MNCAVHIAEGSVHCPVEYSNSSIVSRMNILTIREAPCFRRRRYDENLRMRG